MLDGALDAQTAAAMATPAPYLTAALDLRPEPSEEAQRWDARATRIESYRHRQLGLVPDDGLVTETEGIEAAIGEAPADYADAIQWCSAAVATDDMAMVQPPVQDLGNDL